MLCDGVVLDVLAREGIVTVPGLSASAVRHMLDGLGHPTHHGHVHGASVAAHQPGNSACWSMADVLGAPHFFEFALALTSSAGRYLGQTPRLYSLNAFTTYPIDGPLNPDIQEWHRDRDDSRFLALFVYLTDVLHLEDGAHQFQGGTHEGAESGKVFTILGPAGTAFLADTRGLHRGERPVGNTRTMAWARWCISDPPASYLWDAQTPASRDVLGDRYPADPSLRESIKLVVR